MPSSDRSIPKISAANRRSSYGVNKNPSSESRFNEMLVEEELMKWEEDKKKIESKHVEDEEQEDFDY